jgi:hypothetical protein
MGINGLDRLASGHGYERLQIMSTTLDTFVSSWQRQVEVLKKHEDVSVIAVRNGVESEYTPSR